MGRQKKTIILPHLYDAKGDMEKNWFVEYSVRNPYTDELERKRIFIGKKKTKEERLEEAEAIIDDLRKKLASGWTPFRPAKEVYSDELLIQTFAARWGKLKESVPTIRKSLSEFLEYKRPTIIPHSFQTYRSKLRIFAEWAEAKGIDTLHISAITREHIFEFMRFIVENNRVSVRTMKKYRQILHGFFDYMVRVREIGVKNPVHDIPDMGRLTDKAPRPIPEIVRKRLMRYLAENDPQLWLVCVMEYYCAIRPNELRLLQIKDLDMERQCIRIPCTISKNRLTETVVMPAQLAKILQAQKLDRYGADCYLFSAGGAPGKDPLGKNTLRYRFDRIRTKLGLSEDYKLYSFKHTGGAELVNAGIDTWELQRHFRHKSIDTTERYLRKNFATKSDTIKNHFPDV